MKIHSSVVTPEMIYAAAKHASNMGYGRIYVTFMAVGSRARKGAFNVSLTSDGTVTKRRTNPGSSSDRDTDYAASWEAWGFFLGYLYAKDEAMIVGSPGNPVYGSLTDYIAKTERYGSARGAKYLGFDFIPTVPAN